MKQSEKLERHSKIVRMHVKGFKTKFIADSFDMKIDTIRWIIRQKCKKHDHCRA